MRNTLFLLILAGFVKMGASLTDITNPPMELPSTPIEQEVGTGNYKFDKEGNLIRPEGYRQWVYIGTPLTPNDMNNGQAAFPEFHNVYIHPDDFKHWEEVGNFRDGTIIIKELVSVGSKKAVSGNGYFMGDFAGLEATIKDSKRFPNEPGNWAYFSFGHKLPYTNTAKAFPTNACNTCHETSAADDFVFTQYYPILSNAKGIKKTIGAVYTATNKVDGNTIIAYGQNGDGSLNKIGEYITGGMGTGNVEIFEGSKNDPTHPLADGVDPLISAYGVFKTADDNNLLVVNAGSSTISSMKVNHDYSLELVNTVKAGDKYPLSIASHGDLVYLASSGTATAPPFSGNIMGYRIDRAGALSPIGNSKRDLGARPSSIAFTDDGKFLIVNELVTGMIKVFQVNLDGNISAQPISKVSSPHAADKGRWLAIPVGIDLVKKSSGYVVLVSEARFLNNQGALREEAGKVPQSPLYSWQTSSTSSYLIDSKGNIKLVSQDVLTGQDYENGQIANCWVEVSSDGNTLYAANALSSSISTYNIGNSGKITLKEETEFKDDSESLFFSDLYLSKDGKFLNQLIGNKGKIMTFKVTSNGQLSPVGVYGDMPEIGCYGLISL